MKNVVGKQNI